MRIAEWFWSRASVFVLPFVAPSFGALAPLAAQASADGEVWTDAKAGFRIARPADDWRFDASRDPATSLVTLKIYPKARKTAIEVGVRVSATEEATAAEVQGKALAKVRADEKYAKTETFVRELDGRQAPGLRTELHQAGQVFVIEQLYVVADGRRFVLQSHAPKAQWREHAAAFARAWKSLRIIEPSAEGAARWRRNALAARCGSEIDWRADWADAARRGRAGKRPVLVIVRSYPGYNLPDATRWGAFMDPDVVELVGERFVAMRLRDGGEVPFRSQKNYGMSRTTFGFGLLIVSPNGDVLAETHATQSDAVFAFLREAIVAHPEFVGDAVDAAADPLERAAHHLRRGEDEAAAALLEDTDAPRGLRLRASLHRRARRGEAALADLERAREAGGDPAELDLEVVGVNLRLGRDADAVRALDRVEGREPDVLFWRGVLAARAGVASDARAVWERLIAEHPEHRLAWQVAAVLSVSALDKGLRTEWPDEALLASLRTPPFEPLRRSQIAKAEREALAFLLDAQREDGSWICPSEVNAPGMAPNPFVDAIAAICGQVLLARRDDAACAKAARAALEFVDATWARGKQNPPERSFMDYTVWSHSFLLWFVADCVEAKVGDAAKLRRIAGEMVASLQDKQKPGGGWSYYVTRDLTDDASAQLSFSFVTAVVVLALHRAAEVGIEVPQTLLARGLDCLEASRSDRGAFAYAYQPGAEKTVQATRANGAAGRGPLCELALLRGGRGKVEQVGAALATFRRLRGDYAKQLGKVLMHAGPDGEGCHYLMFDYAFAAAAVRALPAGQRAAHRGWLADMILAARSTEGSFRGTPINGWSFGTAMALRAFADLAPSGR